MIDKATTIIEVPQGYTDAGSVELKTIDDLPLILVGDGAQLCYNSWESDKVLLAPEHLRFQRASAVCMAALPRRGLGMDPAQLVPQYLRLPQAQRELLQKQKKI